MDLVTQIGGKYRPENKSLLALKEKLTSMGIEVTHPISSEHVLSDSAAAFGSAVFSIYDLQLDYYESIADSDFHIVSNTYGGEEGYIGENTAREILYAMLKNKPIILLFTPKLKPSINPLAKDIINRHLGQLYIKNILELSNQAAKIYLEKVASTPVEYSLSVHEKTLIRARIRAYFRESIPAIETA